MSMCYECDHAGGNFLLGNILICKICHGKIKNKFEKDFKRFFIDKEEN